MDSFDVSTKEHCGNCKQRTPQTMASRLSRDAACNSPPCERGQTWKCRGKPETRRINTATGVVYIKARCFPLKWWIMSQETSKLWLEKKRSCWVTVAVWWGGDALALQRFLCTGRSVTCCLCASKGGRRRIFVIINWIWGPNRSFRLVCTRSFRAKPKKSDDVWVPFHTGCCHMMDLTEDKSQKERYTKFNLKNKAQA